MSPLRKATLRRMQCREQAAATLKALGNQNGDAYELYQKLYALWCSNSAAVLELRPLFRIPGIEPGSTFSVTIELKERIRSLANEILPAFIHTEKNT
jgi:hypothetical protein